MSTIKEISPIANKILKNHFLCDYCLGRLFSKKIKSSSNRFLGKKLKDNAPLSGKCYICKDLFDNLSPYLDLLLETSSNYEFSSFMIGLKIKPSIIDRDDHIRSKYHLQGTDSIKTAIAHDLSKKFIAITKKRLDFLDPEITFTIDLREKECTLRSKQISLYGRYLKTKRGFPQKQKPCTNCSGKGCRVCSFHGLTSFDSVEGMVSRLLFQKIGGTVAKFTWIGGEDKSSLVLGNGRPFFVKLHSPLKRIVRFPKVVKNEFIEIHDLKIIPDTPKRTMPFRSTIRIKIITKNQILSSSLKNLKKSLKSPIVIYENNEKRSEKKIFQCSYKKNSNKSLTLKINTEGGLPVKRFVSGDNVDPGVSKIIDNPCVCKEFDFLETIMITNN